MRYNEKKEKYKIILSGFELKSSYLKKTFEVILPEHLKMYLLPITSHTFSYIFLYYYKLDCVDKEMAFIPAVLNYISGIHKNTSCRQADYKTNSL